MKKNVFILLIISCILIIFTSILFAEEIKYDFRKTNWGMSKEQVKVTEGVEIVYEEEEEIDYKVEIMGSKFLCGYIFLEDKLYQSGYLFDEIHTNENDYIDDYEELKETLIKKYGEPKIDETTWKNDLYKDDKTDWGFAISIGDLIYDTRWETDNTEIRLRLSGDNYKIHLVLAYDSRELEEWVKKIKEEKAKSNF